MDDKELFEAWRASSDQEKRWLKHHQGEYFKIAHSQSNDIFAKIRKNMLWEAIISVIVAIIFPFLFLNNAFFFWIIVILMILSVLAGVKVYGKYYQDMKRLNETSILESLKKKLMILSRYVRQLNIYVIIFMILGFAAGFAFALQDEEIEPMKVLVMAGFSLPFLILLIWLGRKYIHVLYGKHLKRIEEIYHNLIEN